MIVEGCYSDHIVNIVVLALFVEMWAWNTKSSILGLERVCCSDEMGLGHWSGDSIVGCRVVSHVLEVGICQIGYLS